MCDVCVQIHLSTDECCLGTCHVFDVVGPSHLGSVPSECTNRILTIWTGWARWCSVWVLKNIIGDDLLARLIASSRYKDVYEFKQWEVNKDAYIREFYEKVIAPSCGDEVSN